MRRSLALVLSLILVLLFNSITFSADFKVNGVYTAWGLSQNKFFLGKNDGNDNYFVQMLRFKLQAVASDNLKAVTRFDIAQGWWGVDNVVRTKIPGSGSALFDNKDTNFLMHVDQAYIDFKCPNIPVNFKVGRMWYGVGNKLLLDNNLDGVQADINVKKVKLHLGWAKVSEGYDGLSDNSSLAKADRYGNTDARDANLFLGNINSKGDKHELNLFGLYYNDASVDDGTAYLMDGLDYFRPRFSPHVTQLAACGLSGSLKMGKLSVIGEFDYLTGKDDINNTTYGAKEKYDINDGTLSGYNLYLKPVFKATPKFSLGGVFGMGSGDDDKTGGKGNVNKLRTSGFFYVTEIWEDSIMPDEEGITPQGLGAPNTRGYREFENTTLFQINATYNVKKNLKAFVSYTYITATQPIHEWSTDESGNTTIGPNSSSDIGTEVDFKVDYKIYNNLIFTVRGGMFTPGDAAGYLINGTNKYNENVKELKTTLTYKF